MRLILALLFACAAHAQFFPFPGPGRAGASAANVTAIGYRSSQGTTPSSSLNTTGASLIVIGCGTFGAACHPASGEFSDSAGNTYTALAQETGGNNRVQLFYKCGPATSATHTWTSADTDSIFIAVYSGTATSSCLSSGSYHTNYGSNPSVSTGTLGETDDLIVTVAIDNSAAGDRTVTGDNATLTKQIEYFASASFMTGALGDTLDYNATTSLQSTWTQCCNFLGVAIAGFKK